jgi:hypothetical protein
MVSNQSFRFFALWNTGVVSLSFCALLPFVEYEEVDSVLDVLDLSTSCDENFMGFVQE